MSSNLWSLQVMVYDAYNQTYEPLVANLTDVSLMSLTYSTNGSQTLALDGEARANNDTVTIDRLLGALNTSVTLSISAALLGVGRSLGVKEVSFVPQAWPLSKLLSPCSPHS